MFLSLFDSRKPSQHALRCRETKHCEHFSCSASLYLLCFWVYIYCLKCSNPFIFQLLQNLIIIMNVWSTFVDSGPNSMTSAVYTLLHGLTYNTRTYYILLPFNKGFIIPLLRRAFSSILASSCANGESL